jgi:hypothetical protein
MDINGLLVLGYWSSLSINVNKTPLDPGKKTVFSSVGTPSGSQERLFHPQHEKPQTKSTLQQGGHADNGNFYCLMIGQSSVTRFMEDLLLPCLIACTRGQTPNITLLES